MQRKSIALFLQEWLLFSIVSLPFWLPVFFSNIDITKLFVEFFQFTIGGLTAVTPTILSWYNIPVFLSVVFVTILIYGVIDDLISLTIGFPKKAEWINRLHKLPLLETLFLFVFTVILEELIYRWFVLRELHQWLGEGEITFIILLVISCAVFAYAHISNYEGGGRVVIFIPFFAMSLGYAYSFVKFGLIGCVLVHFCNNLLSTLQNRLYTKFFGKHPSFS